MVQPPTATILTARNNIMSILNDIVKERLKKREIKNLGLRALTVKNPNYIIMYITNEVKFVHHSII